MNGFNKSDSPRFNITPKKPSKKESLLMQGCLSTIDIYSNPDTAETCKPPPSNRNKPALKKKPSVAKPAENEPQTAHGDSENKKKHKSKPGYENVIDKKESYENVESGFKTNLSSSLSEKSKAPVPKSPDTSTKISHAKAPSGGPKIASPTTKSPAHSGPVFEDSCNKTAKKRPLFADSSSKPTMGDVGRKTSLEGAHVSRITISGSNPNPRISYIDNPAMNQNSSAPKKSPKAHDKSTKPEDLQSSLRSSGGLIDSTPSDVYSLATNPNADRTSKSSTNSEELASGPQFGGDVYSQVFSNSF